MEMVAIKCPTCKVVTSVDPWYAMVTPCPKCGGRCEVVGKYVERIDSKNTVRISVKADGLDEIEKQLERIRGLTIEFPDLTVQKQKYIMSCEGMRGYVTLEALKKFGEETVEAIKHGDIAVIPRGFKLTILNEDGTSTTIG